MRIDKEKQRLSESGASFCWQPQGLVAKVLTMVLGAVLLVAVSMISLLLLAVMLTGGLLAWGYLWWITWKLRKQFRGRQTGGRVIEGKVIRDIGSDDGIQH